MLWPLKFYKWAIPWVKIFVYYWGGRGRRRRRGRRIKEFLFFWEVFQVFYDFYEMHIILYQSSSISFFLGSSQSSPIFILKGEFCSAFQIEVGLACYLNFSPVPGLVAHWDQWVCQKQKKNHLFALRKLIPFYEPQFRHPGIWGFSPVDLLPMSWSGFFRTMTYRIGHCDFFNQAANHFNKFLRKWSKILNIWAKLSFLSIL